MNTFSVEDVIRANKILPVLVIDDLSDAIPVFQSIEEGGLQCIEITLRTEVGLSAIASCAENFENICVGAGTVLTRSQASDAIHAGAQFLVSPGFDQGVLECCQYFNIPYFPGTATATEIQKAMTNNIKTVKFFPAEQMGGLETISALSSALGDVNFMPSGGINEENFISYLQHPKVNCIGGSWMATRKDIKEKNFDLVKSKIHLALSTIKSAGV